MLPHQVREYGIPRYDEGGEYDIDDLVAYNPEMFKRLLTDNVDDCYNEDIHDKLMKEVFAEEKHRKDS